MSIARSTVTEEIPSNGAGWSWPVRFWADRARTTLRTITSASALMRRRSQVTALPEPVAFSVENSRLAIDGGVVTLSLSAEETAVLVPGDYELVVDVVLDGDRPLQVRKPAKVIP